MHEENRIGNHQGKQEKSVINYFSRFSRKNVQRDITVYTYVIQFFGMGTKTNTCELLFMQHKITIRLSMKLLPISAP